MRSACSSTPGTVLQIAGTNYLIPVQARIQKEADAELEAVNAEWLLKQMEFAGNRVNIVISGCLPQQSPLARGIAAPIRAWRGMDAAKGHLHRLFDGAGTGGGGRRGRNSPYTAALAKQMLKPGIALEENLP